MFAAVATLSAGSMTVVMADAARAADEAQAAATGVTELISVTANGQRAAGDSNLRHGGGALSADGRYVAFYSFRDSVARGDGNALPDVFLRDRDRSMTLLVSAATTGGAGDGWSGLPSISDDGRLVCFMSAAGNLVANDRNDSADIFVWNRDTGRTELVSVASGGAPGDDASLESALSADGRYVAFTSFASNLATPDPDRRTHIYLRDRDAGVTERMTVGLRGELANSYSWEPSVSADGRYVAFYSNADNLVADDRGQWSDVFVRDRRNGQTHRVSVSSAGVAGNDYSVQPMISANGRYVVFVSLADNLVAGDTNARIDVFVHDLELRTTERVSVGPDGRQANDASDEPSISADGRYVTFESYATNLVAGDTNRQLDVFVHDRESRTTRRVSVGNGGSQANEASWTPSLSADGRHVAFRSDANNLAANDLNTSSDVYVHDLALRTEGETAFTLKPGALDFGAQAVGSRVTQAFWLRNKGTDALAIRTMELRGVDASSFALSHGCSTSLAAGQACALRVTFQPGDSGAKQATLRVTAGDGAVRTRALAGTAMP
jgi:Periplasmic component of the Tol biopolymer transport system